MRVAHAEYRPRPIDHSRFCGDFRGGLGLVLSMDRKAHEGSPDATGGKAGSPVPEVSGDSAETLMDRLHKRLRIFQRLDILEARMDWLEALSGVDRATDDLGVRRI